MIRSSILFLLSLYQKTVSPDHGLFSGTFHTFGVGCSFYPSCSVYAQKVITDRGVLVGLRETILRVARCHPFSRGGYDPPALVSKLRGMGPPSRDLVEAGSPEGGSVGTSLLRIRI